MWLSEKIKIRRLRKTWRKNNQHNGTSIVKPAYMECISVGKHTYGRIDAQISNSSYYLKVGNFCSIADNVKIILGSEHKYTCLSTFPFNSRIRIIDNLQDSTGKGDITIDDDVWIGYGATILSGVYIGQGAVVAAGAVVTKNVPPYTVVGGVPAKVIKHRFSPDVIDYMRTLDYGKLEEPMIKEHIADLYQSIDNLPLEEIKELFDWFPKKG